MGTDTKFVQTASNLLNGTNLAVDGSWGNATWTAFDNLLTKFNIECQSPTTNAWHMQVFCFYVMKPAFKDKNAGFYTSPYC